MLCILLCTVASLHRQPKRRCWYCAFTDQHGKRHFRSTKTTDKKQAREICQSWEKAARLAQVGCLNADQARQVISSGVSDVLLAAGESLPTASIREWCDRWLKTKQIEAEESTHSRYRVALQPFLEFLGERANRDLNLLTPDDVLRFRDEYAKRVSVGSVNTALRIVRACFSAATTQGLLEKNPVSQVKNLKEKGESKRRALSMDEIRTILNICGDTEWRGLVLLGLYTGQRLKDCAGLKWNQVDLQKKTITFTAQKTGKRLCLHLVQAVEDYLLTLPSEDEPTDPVLPRLAAMANNSSRLSDAFAKEVLIPAGLMTERPGNKKGTGKGRSGRREVNEVTFHNLRHTFVTWLKNAGASHAVAEMIAGHGSSAVSRQYTHLGAQDTVAPLTQLPNVAIEK